METQERWLEELARVSREWVLVSVHGNPYRARLTDEERRAFDSGEVVVQWGVVPGTNLCAAFHPRSALERLVAPRFDLVSYIPEGRREIRRRISCSFASSPPRARFRMRLSSHFGTSS